jgi:hypothetical protein
MRLLAGLLLTTSWACGGEGPEPTPPPLTLVLPATVEGRLVACGTCADPTPRVVAEFPVGVSDAQGPGGSIDRLETIVMNRSRGLEVGRNVRPNADYAFPDSTVPARGQLVVQAGIVFGPPPPRDEIVVTVRVHLTDDRQASSTVPLAIVVAATASP